MCIRDSTSAGVRTTQRSWLRYRDAWVALAAVRWPALPQEVWLAWLSLSLIHI